MLFYLRIGIVLNDAFLKPCDDLYDDRNGIIDGKKGQQHHLGVYFGIDVSAAGNRAEGNFFIDTFKNLCGFAGAKLPPV